MENEVESAGEEECERLVKCHVNRTDRNKSKAADEPRALTVGHTQSLQVEKATNSSNKGIVASHHLN